MIAIVDYGMGNLRSVFNAFEAIGQDARITCDPADLKQAKAVVLPGVGAFGDGMSNLQQAGLMDVLMEEVMVKRKPYLGICLGLQFLADTGFEHGVHKGLGWIRGVVKRIEPETTEFRVPHIGWNDLRLKQDSPLFRGLEDGPVFYFVHSYHLVVQDEDAVSATCWHGTRITAALQKDNIYGVQFHPEKSQLSGLRLLRNFVGLID